MVALRRQVFGSADLLGSTENEWLGQSFVFHDGETVEAYSLKMHKTSTKGLAMCVQGFILKHLLFNRRGARVVADPTVLLRATTKAQEEALVGALSDILWRAGERQHAVLCLAQENIYVNDTPSYQSDGCTERIHTFEFKKQDELTFNLKKYLFEFLADEGNGLLLFLYSLVLSRGFNKLNEDMGGEEVSLLCTNAIIHPCLATLMLTGRATLFLHNGIIYEGSEDTMAKPKTGIITRAEVGLLVWRRPEEGGQVNVGSRLKTPSFPVWVTSTNQKSATIITIDTRNQTVKEEYNSPYLENLIHTKWQGADVNWNGTAPFV
ncbi:Inactive ubiquitin carboxyl-terminal hydrolase MINDY-4B-like 2 [Homarus americanus]|uniref:Ubiquitin carboxyl-terminal hydrolase MINDY n=1 Tax=Homarus americanus TaxID=6706 RepID=A0A8J5KJK5_HOMAM|nr:Inactive ubiquitin carboxyl-terminal hydrolase MINDY-4B-like 2 [Homarus americanus]